MISLKNTGDGIQRFTIPPFYCPNSNGYQYYDFVINHNLNSINVSVDLLHYRSSNTENKVIYDCNFQGGTTHGYEAYINDYNNVLLRIYRIDGTDGSTVRGCITKLA